MKKYIILTGTIARMGGAQMYVSNKAKYVKKKGWQEFVFSGDKGPILINNLQKYERNIIQDLDEAPQFYSRKNRIKIIERIVKIIEATPKDEIIIESNTIVSAYWAELLAQRIKCKHFIFLLGEEFRVTLSQKEFFKYKLNRNELSVIKEHSLKILFGENFSIENPEQYVLVAPCNNVVDDVQDSRFDNIQYKKYDHVICSLGRLDKKYIPTVIKGFEKFAKNTKDRILYIFIGDQPEEYPIDIPKKIKNAFQEIDNVTLLLPGYVFPIPRSIMKNIDLAIASSGSAAVLADEGVTTITMDGEDGQPIGVLGYDTQERLFRTEPRKFELSNLMNEVIFNGYLSRFKYHMEKGLDDDAYMEQHFDFTKRSKQSKEFYNVELFKNNRPKLLFKRIFINCFGVFWYRKLSENVHKRCKLISKGKFEGKKKQ